MTQSESQIVGLVSTGLRAAGRGGKVTALPG